MQYISKSSGFLMVSDVMDGDKLIIVEEAKSKFVEAKQATYWNVKVQLPDGTFRQASPFDKDLDAMSAKWGDQTEKWIGHTITVEVKTGKTSGKQYIAMTPTDDPIVQIEVKEASTGTVGATEGISEADSYPTDIINPADIPF